MIKQTSAVSQAVSAVFENFGSDKASNPETVNAIETIVTSLWNYSDKDSDGVVGFFAQMAVQVVIGCGVSINIHKLVKVADAWRAIREAEIARWDAERAERLLEMRARSRRFLEVSQA